MILVLMMLVLASALATTLAAVTLNNLQSARRSDEAARVLSAAEAGVSQAVTFMRQNGVATLHCRNTATPPSSPSWNDCGNAYGRSNPVGPAGPIAGGARYFAWVEEVTRLTTSVDQGVYRVHAVGTLKPGAVASCGNVAGACRSITAEVVVSNFGLGSGIYSKAIAGNSSGNATITDESIFTTGCFPMRGRSSLVITGFDAAHHIHAGVHTSGIIVDGPASGCGDVSNSIHSAKPCSTKFPYDQDSRGGSLAGWPDCAQALTDSADVYGGKANTQDGVWGSKIESQQSMQDAFDLDYPPLTNDQVDRLKAIAEEDHTDSYTTAWPDPLAAAASRGVFYFDLSGKTGHDAEVDLARLPAPFNQESAACNGPVVIIKNGNAVISPSDKDAVVGASVFLLSGGGTGVATLNGGHLYGGLFAEAINFSGNTYLQPANCAGGASNPALLTISVRSYSEDD